MQGRPTNEKNNSIEQQTITFIEAPSAYNCTKELKKALVKQPLFTLFLKNSDESIPYDIYKQTIPALDLVCFDVGVYFDPLFSGERNILYAGPNSTKRAIENSCCILIFANKSKEVDTIKAGIREVMGNHPTPPILLATTLNKDLSTTNAATFWGQVREAIDKLPTNNPMPTPQ